MLIQELVGIKEIDSGVHPKVKFSSPQQSSRRSLSIASSGGRSSANKDVDISPKPLLRHRSVSQSAEINPSAINDDIIPVKSGDPKPVTGCDESKESKRTDDKTPTLRFTIGDSGCELAVGKHGETSHV